MNSALDMREYILEIAGRLFYEHGLRAIGVDRVITEASIAKATLYRHFPTKECLMLTYLRRRSDAALQAINDELSLANEEPAAKVEMLFDRLIRVMGNGFRGCAFIRALSEHLESEEIRAETQRHKAAVQVLIGNLVSPLPIPAKDRKQLRETISLLYEGALSMGLVYQNNLGAKNAKKAAMALFDQSKDR